MKKFGSEKKLWHCDIQKQQDICTVQKLIEGKLSSCHIHLQIIYFTLNILIFWFLIYFVI